jgi:hypothetical protein
MHINPVQPYARLATRERCAHCGGSGHSSRNCPRKAYIGQFTKVQGSGVQDSTTQGWTA